MKQKIKSILKDIFYAPFGVVIIFFGIVLTFIVGSYKLYNEIRYHLSEHIFEVILFLIFIVGGIAVSILTYFKNKKKEKNTS
jgi:hypothetical protein